MFKNDNFLFLPYFELKSLLLTEPTQLFHLFSVIVFPLSWLAAALVQVFQSLSSYVAWALPKQILPSAENFCDSCLQLSLSTCPFSPVYSQLQGPQLCTPTRGAGFVKCNLLVKFSNMHSVYLLDSCYDYAFSVNICKQFLYSISEYYYVYVHFCYPMV